MRILFLVIRPCIYLALFISVSVVIVAYCLVSWKMGMHDTIWRPLLSYILLAITAAAGLILFFPFRISSRLSQCKWPGVLRGLTAAVMLIFVAYLLVDTDPPIDRFSYADTTPQGKNTKQAAALIHTFFRVDHGNRLSLDGFQDPNFLRSAGQHSDAILQAWEDSSKQRAVLELLAQFEQIDESVDEESPSIPNYMLYRNIALVYRAYILLKISSGDMNTALKELITVHTVARKSLAGSATLIHKMIWTRILEWTIQLAYHIVENNSLEHNQLTRIDKTFAPLTFAETSYHKVWITEYLFLQQILRKKTLYEKLTSRFFWEEKPLYLELPPHWLLEYFHVLTFRKNRSEALLATLWHPVIDSARTQHTHSYEPWSNFLLSNSSPTLHNLTGWALCQTYPFAMYEEKRGMPLKVRSDLLAIYLNRKMGSTESIADYYSQHANSLQQTGNALIAAGKDQLFGTADDIKLEALYE